MKRKYTRICVEGVKTQLGKTILSTPDRDSNLYLPVSGRPVSSDSSAATEVQGKFMADMSTYPDRMKFHKGVGFTQHKGWDVEASCPKLLRSIKVIKQSGRNAATSSRIFESLNSVHRPPLIKMQTCLPHARPRVYNNVSNKLQGEVIEACTVVKSWDGFTHAPTTEWTELSEGFERLQKNQCSRITKTSHKELAESKEWFLSIVPDGGPPGRQWMNGITLSRPDDKQSTLSSSCHLVGIPAEKRPPAASSRKTNRTPPSN
uniref:(California timema) hypothetical protein n=1 Tax=Timema californicum TaxID=61474 RepID=A0A7R9IWC4_TIMCA|nr:unnamed protein product [Timema californicum]